MIIVENKSFSKDGKTPEAHVYQKLGSEEVERINAENREWLDRQSFADKAPPIEFAKMVISGRANAIDPEDHIEWSLKFYDDTASNLSVYTPGKWINDGLLHIGREDRLPDVQIYNGGPCLFSTANYIDVRVLNGEGGWVMKGEFPKNVHLVTRTEELENGVINPKVVPVFTNIKRDILVGFNAAGEWAKFRTMAIACSDYVVGKLEEERVAAAPTPGEEQGISFPKYNAQQLRRSRMATAIPLTFQFMPNTMLSDGPGALTPSYMPGVLEGALALELEKGVRAKYGQKEHYCPISYMKGSPISFAPQDEGGYSAFFDFTLYGCLHGLKPGTQERVIVRESLGKYFNVSLDDSSDITFRMRVPNAHKVYEEVLEGSDDTLLHRETKRVISAVGDIRDLSASWKSEETALRDEYNTVVGNGKNAHFGELEKKLGTNPSP